MSAPLTWHFPVDWDEDGSYDADEAAGRLRGFTSRRGREDYLKPPDQGGFERHVVGEATLTLDDPDE
jgi:hypothetical protein